MLLSHVEMGEVGWEMISLKSSSKFHYFCLLKVFTELSEALRSNKDKSKRKEERGNFYTYNQSAIFIDIIYSHTCIFSYSTGRQNNYPV